MRAMKNEARAEGLRRCDRIGRMAAGILTVLCLLFVGCAPASAAATLDAFQTAVQSRGGTVESSTVSECADGMTFNGGMSMVSCTTGVVIINTMYAQYEQMNTRFSSLAEQVEQTRQEAVDSDEFGTDVSITDVTNGFEMRNLSGDYSGVWFGVYFSNDAVMIVAASTSVDQSTVQDFAKDAGFLDDTDGQPSIWYTIIGLLVLVIIIGGLIAVARGSRKKAKAKKAATAAAVSAPTASMPPTSMPSAPFPSMPQASPTSPQGTTPYGAQQPVQPGYAGQQPVQNGYAGWTGQQQPQGYHQTYGQ